MVVVLELFSGIGGMRCGLSEGVGSEQHLKFTSIDLNEFCNKVYNESFGDRPLTLDICALNVDWFEKLKADVWTMSPPCQPYSRQGKGLGSRDERGKPLHHLIHVIDQLVHAPKLIIVENVKNFEESDSFHILKTKLERKGYSLYGYLLNPLYLGFPNSRLRFFLVAVLDGKKNEFMIRCNDLSYPEFDRLDLVNWHQKIIRDFLCPHHDTECGLEVPESLLAKPASFAFDIVSKQSKQCLCFTRSYKKYINGTGSVLINLDHSVVQSMVTETDEKQRPKFGNLKSMTELEGSLRYFCPLEAARLNGFNVNDDIAPWSLRFNDACRGNIQYYRAVGNSLNPHVVAFLVKRHWPF